MKLYAPSYGRNPAALAFTLKAIGLRNTGRCNVWEVGHEHTRQPAYLETLPTKLRAYEAVYWLNRSFEAALLSLERLERLGIFRLEYLNEYKIRLEHTRAEANEELIDTLHEREMDDSGRFDRMERELENQRKDPDDVFFHARDRKQEIREQMKELQSGLNRLKPKYKKKHSRRKTGKSH